MSYSKLAAGLGISKSRVGFLVQRGMPTDSVETAQRWRDANMDTAWKVKRPPINLVEHVLCHVAFPMLTRPEMLALASREAGIPATGEQIARMSGFYALLCMSVIGEALERAGLQFEVGHFPRRGSPEEAALVAKLDEILRCER